MFVCCECCVLSHRGLYDKLITRPEESYRLLCVVVCDLETSGMKRPWPALGRSALKKTFVACSAIYHTGSMLSTTEVLVLRRPSFGKNMHHETKCKRKFSVM
jgi:hypothetical protein